MENTRIITLSPDTSISSVTSTFEEAFGEYSNMSAKRKAKKIARVEARKEVKAAKQAAKAEKKVGRQEVRQQKQVAKVARKVENRSAKQAARQEVKSNRIAARVDRKATKVQARADRKSIRHPKAHADEPILQEEVTKVAPDEVVETQTAETPQEQGYQETATETQPESVGSGSEQEAVVEEQQYESQPQEQSYQPQSQQENYQSEEAPQEESYETEESVYEDDGDGGNEQEVTGGDDDTSSADGVKPENKIVSIARKVEWNKELIQRLRAKRAALLTAGKPVESIDVEINKRINRVKELEQGFMSFCSADGGRHQNRRKSKVHKAIRQARRERQELRRKKRQIHGGDEAPSLHLESVSRRNRRHPNAGYSNATGPVSIAESGGNDYDAEAPRIIEIQSNADGAKRVNWKYVAVGAGLAVVAIWAIRKYKPFGIGK